ncbi:MAG: YggS family pyridoxal phosphate-dependent enzyme [Ignavibacteriaceae bacterium]|jgi:pyridoxal phosphate enzyme (YggS family)|nr:YggS family pyridoxal phosphate-dependent enzyme [Ignavibacteriaceae bacterium]
MIAENLAILRRKIEEACKKADRNTADVKIIAVSKYFGIDSILEAKKIGLTDFGENRAQELTLKFEKLGNEVIWHFIGTLQKNKVKYVVNSAELIHSVDSFELVEEINKRAEKIEKVQKILLEVKTSEEETKSGLETENEIINLVQKCSEMKNIKLNGLMTMAPLTDDVNIIRKSFRDLRNLKVKINNKGYNLTELSMGMTSDFEIAIEEGATMVRIGSAIFGDRDYSKDWRQI